jgi:hypothetical protein
VLKENEVLNFCLQEESEGEDYEGEGVEDEEDEDELVGEEEDVEDEDGEDGKCMHSGSQIICYKATVIPPWQNMKTLSHCLLLTFLDPT